MHTQNPTNVEGADRTSEANRATEVRGRVLVVDDDACVREVSCRMLQRLGYAVAAAVNGRDALDYYRANPGWSDLVLLDLAMPVMDGYDCCLELRRINPLVRVVVMTGQPPKVRDPGWCGDAVRTILYKPFTADALHAAVCRALAGA